MQALYFLVGLIGVFYIIWWSVKNDKVTSQEEQTGLLRMVKPPEPKAKQQSLIYGSTEPPQDAPTEQTGDPPDRRNP